MQDSVLSFTKKRVEKIVADLLVGECEDLAEFFTDEERLNSFIDLFVDQFDEREVNKWMLETVVELKATQLNKPKEKRKFFGSVEQIKQHAEEYITKEKEELLALEMRLKDMIGIILREVRLPVRDNSVELNLEKDSSKIIEWKPRKDK